jgi:ribosomal protein L11 methyltransferase
MLDLLVSVSESELLADLLWKLGVVAIEEREALDGFITLRTSMGEELTYIRDFIEAQFPNVIISIAHIDRSVADTWRTHAVPTWVNEEVVLCPSWVISPDAAYVIRIEPAETFGLGNHPTTVLALRLGLRHCSRGSKVFDFGCGSGVLAIGMTKILHCESFVFDIALNAQEVVRVNNELNDIHTTWCTDSEKLQADLVFANILAPVLVAESCLIKESVRDSGLIVLSGIRDDQVDEVLRSYGDCYELERESQDGWTAVILRKL